MAVDHGNDLPTVGFKTCRGVIGKPAFDFTVDGNTVVIIKGDEFAQLMGARQRARLVGDAFHQAAIAKKGIGVVIDNIVAGLIKLRGENFLCQRHTRSIGDTLAQRPSSGFNTRRFTQLGMTRRFGMHLAEVF